MISGKKILVTGATGFLGRWVSRELSKENNITAISRSRKNLEKNVEFVKADITDYNSLSCLKGEYDYCLHLAAMADVGFCERNPVEAYDINVNGTVNVLRLCDRLGIKRVIMSSSIKVYGHQAKVPIDEEAVPNPYNYYGLTKALAEQEALKFSGRNGIKVVIARIANIYGPDDSSESRLVPSSILSVIGGKKPVVYGDGSSRRVFVYVKDAASFIAKYMENGISGIYNVGTGSPAKIINVVKSIIDISRKDIRPEFDTRVVQKSDLDISVERAAVAGWSPKYTLDKGLKETFEWYRLKMEGK